MPELKKYRHGDHTPDLITWESSKKTRADGGCTVKRRLRLNAPPAGGVLWLLFGSWF